MPVAIATIASFPENTNHGSSHHIIHEARMHFNVLLQRSMLFQSSFRVLFLLSIAMMKAIA
jgi:hypothetical protein